MKFDYNQEFDIKEIYRKLTAPSQPLMVKASEFFESTGDDNLCKLQAVVERFLTLSTQV
ncbi:MAG: hypothetical protein J1F66_01605 [Clostridiales bacterium]|nr:hypothetical protein [Clostridiales bacterium]